MRAACSVAAAVLALAVAASADARTVVSLTFDDTVGDQAQAGEILAAAGMRGTFYVNSPRIGTADYLTLDQVLALQAAGHEVGGHTLSHVDLLTVSPDEQRHQICDDRAALLADGIRAETFAYPFGHHDAAIEGIVRSCGYVAARDAGGLRAPGPCSGPCPRAETLPPLDPFAIRSAASLTDTTTLDDLERAVMFAELGGRGWLPLTFHHVCAGCNRYGVAPDVLRAFVAWLKPRAASGTVEETVSQALATPPARPAARRPRRCRARASGARSRGCRARRGSP